MSFTSSPSDSSLGFLLGIFFPKQKPKKTKTIRFQKPSKPRPLVTSPRVELSSWHFLEEQFVALPRPPSLSRGFEKFYKVHPGIPERRAGKRITHKWWAFSTFKIFCHSEGISWRCRGCHANAVQSHIFFAFWDESKSLIWVLVGFNPSEKYARQIGHLPQRGVKIPKIFELPPPSFYFIHTLREDSFLSHRFLT